MVYQPATQSLDEPSQRSTGPSAQAVLARNLSVRYNQRPVLQHLTVEIPAGRTIVLLGANGAGKSTLLRVLAMLLPPEAGELRLWGQLVTPRCTRLRARIGMIGHQSMLYRDLSARENLRFFGKLYGVADPSSRCDFLLDRLSLSGRGDEALRNLSRGMVQRVAIARALMHDPDLLLADEPFDGLDAASQRAMESMLAQLRAEGKTLILSNHDIEQSLRLADEVLVLRQGRLALNAPASGLSTQGLLKEME